MYYTLDMESFVVKKVRMLDDVRKLIALTLLHIEIFTVEIFMVYNARVTLVYNNIYCKSIPYPTQYEQLST